MTDELYDQARYADIHHLHHSQDIQYAILLSSLNRTSSRRAGKGAPEMVFKYIQKFLRTEW